VPYPSSAEPSAPPRPGTRLTILEAAESVLRGQGFAQLSTRKVADEAGVALSQIHYHFGSKQKLMLATLRHQDVKLLGRQVSMYGEDTPIWRQWEQACDFYDEDLASGYIRVLQEMIAAGWSDPEIGEAVRELTSRWTQLLIGVAERAERDLGGFGPLSGAQVGTLVALAWLGAESAQLLGMEGPGFDIRGSLRQVGVALRSMEEGGRP
jgi:AcrR family transcriptional regulator